MFYLSEVLNPIIYKKLHPILIDINFDFSMDINQIRNKISNRAKAIIVTHFFGIPSNILEIKEIANEYNLSIIEDCAHILCSKVNGLKLGSTRRFSFHELSKR